MSNKYLALLRGINVGGNNIIKMAELRACLEQLGFEEVQTYIQSGNIIFQSDEKDRQKISDKIENGLAQQFDYKSPPFILTNEELAQAVSEAPKGFGSEPDKYRYDVIFLKPPLTAKQALKSVSMREGVDQAASGSHALYFSRLISQASKSHLSKIVKSPIYQEITIRNWRTTSKLLGMME